MNCYTVARLVHVRRLDDTTNMTNNSNCTSSCFVDNINPYINGATAEYSPHSLVLLHVQDCPNPNHYPTLVSVNKI